MTVSNRRSRWLAAAGSVLAVALIYECFSHGVYSSWMLLAFLFPLVGGGSVYGLLRRIPDNRRPGAPCLCLYDSGLAACTAGSLFRGILEIYGTTSRWSGVYWLAGCLLLLSALLGWLWDLYYGKSQKHTRETGGFSVEKDS